MKTSKTLAAVLAAFLIVLAAAFFSTSHWRAEHGLTVAALMSSKPTGLQGELWELDAKIAPANERRAAIREQLKKYEAKEREVCLEASASLKGMSESERESLQSDLRAGRLSDENVKRPECAVVFAQYQEASTLRRETSALRERLAKYELELGRALAERERIERRIELSETLGYDPEDPENGPEAISNDLLDELTALNDASDAEQNALDAEITPEDLASGAQEEAAARSEDVLRAIFAGQAPELSESADSELTLRLDEMNARERAPQGGFSFKRAFRPKSVVLTSAIGFVLTIFTVLALGVFGLISAITRKPSSPSVVYPGQGPNGAQVVVVNNPQPQRGLSGGRLAFFVVATALGAFFGGPLGAFFGAIIGLISWTFPKIACAIGLLGFVLMGFLAAIVIFIGAVVGSFLL